MRDVEIGKNYSSGESIFREGEKGEVMYVVQGGKVKITKNTPSGEILIATLGSGEIFGEMALFDRMPRSANALADGDATVLSVDKKKLFTSINRDPTLVFKILESMSRRIRNLDDFLSKLKEDKACLSDFCFDIETTCTTVLQEAKEVIKADNGSVMLADNVGRLSIKAAFGKELDPKLKLNIGEGIAGEVLRSGKTALVNNVSVDSRFVHGTLEIRSLLCAPLKFKDSPFGVINMSNTAERLFTLDDMKLLNSLAVYSSVAIQNAMNFSSLDEATSEVLRNAGTLNG